MRLKLGQTIEQVFYYAVLFLILREWLKPIIELTSMNYLNVFMAFIAICFLLNVLQINFIVSAAVKMLFMAIAVTRIYSGFWLWSGEGFSFLIDDIRINIGALLGFDFAGITNPFRTVLFFVLLWMLAYLMHYWLTVRMSIFYFLVLTIFFIATLNTFTAYDGTSGIVMVLMLGLLVSAVLYLKRMLFQTGESLNLKQFMLFVLPIGLVVLAVGFVATVLPKAEPQWNDPVPYIKQLTGAGGGNSVSKVGIGEDDTELGGAFFGDDTVVYEIEASKAQYWRVETKDIYTSKGWEATDLGTADVTFAYPTEMPVGPVENDEMAKVTSKIDATYILQNYGMNGLQLPLEQATVQYDYGKARLDSYIGEEKVALESYEIAYSSPEYSYTALKNSNVEPGVADPLYLQLPETLPQRVYDLANELTSIYPNEYDKAKAIERYFKTSGFVYETTDVAVPGEGQDYVDQFLFETKRGYCDNFSTSMVVMLRAIGIEARWVKGYAEGDQVRQLENGMYLYEIENNHAHSWVEAYIEGVGWMMFEPTIGFSNQIDIDFDMELNTDTPEEEVVKQEQARQQQQLEKERDLAQRDEVKKTARELPKWLWIVGLVAALLLATLIITKRKTWMPKMEIARQRMRPTDVETAYERLLKHLARNGLRKRKDETIREFAVRVDRHTGTEDMTKITEVYERAIYSKNDSVSFDDIKEYWENLINRSSG